VIHAMGGEQDMRKMGGLRKKIPWTYWTMLIGTLAIAGIPGFAGFFSKDEILSAAYMSPYGSKLLWAVGILTALLTSFYMFRLIFLTFCGAPRYDEHETHVHESPSNMVTPLVILAVLSIVGGWFAAPALWGGVDYFEKYLSPVFAFATSAGEPTSPADLAAAASLEHQLMFAAIAAALLGLFLAWWMYIKRPDQPKKLSESLSAVYHLLLGKYFIDELYAAVIVRPLLWISRNVLWHTVDERIIDGAVNGVADTARNVGEETRKTESGNTRSYAAWIVVGAVAFTSLLLWLVVR